MIVPAILLRNISRGLTFKSISGMIRVLERIMSLVEVKRIDFAVMIEILTLQLGLLDDWNAVIQTT